MSNQLYYVEIEKFDIVKLKMLENQLILELSVKSIKTGVFDQSFVKLMVAKQLLLFSYNSNFRNT